MLLTVYTIGAILGLIIGTMFGYAAGKDLG